MSQVVQAKCPHCQNVLRIPEDYLDKPMRCKHCKNTFQAKTKSSAAKVPVAQPANAVKAGVPIAQAHPATNVAVGLPAPPSKNGNAFGFEEEEEPRPSIAKSRRGGGALGMLLLVGMFFFLFVLGLGAVGFVGYKVYELQAKKDGGDPIVKGDGVRDGVVNPIRDAVVDKKPVNNDKVNPALDDGKKPPKKDNGKTDGKKPVFTNDPFPRRALVINVNNYLMFSTVHYGSPQDGPRYPGSSSSVLRDRLTRPPMNFPVTQVYELSDGIPEGFKGATKPHSTQKSVIETTITDFLNASREQDRIMVIFAGHGIHLEDKSYLIPIDGNKANPESLVPLTWVYDQLAKCKAQQKILVLDVFRYSPSRGNELPSPGEGEEGKMPEGFDKDLMNPPAGVQVWSACVKEQVAVELDEGSAFLQALCNSLQGGGAMKGISAPTQPIPIEDIVTDVNERLKKLLASEKRTQVSRLTGKPGAANVAFNPQEPLSATLTLKPPTVAGGEAAGAATVERILEELRLMPPVRDTRASDMNLLRAQNLPAFSAKKIDSYKPDGYQNVTELVKRYKGNNEAFAKDYPLRAAYFDTLEALTDSNKLKMREVLGSPVDPKRKAAFLLEQDPLGRSIFKLKGALAGIKEAQEKREMETSRRWQANFDYMHARLLSRLMYIYEYNYILGKIRGDDLPELEKGQTGWRVGIAGAKITVTDPDAKAYQKDVQKLWKRIQEDYPDTPWSLFAQRESMIALGLAWRPKSD